MVSVDGWSMMVELAMVDFDDASVRSNDGWSMKLEDGKMMASDA